MSDLTQLCTRIAGHFHEAFGRPPLDERLQDILTRATTLGRCTDLDHARDETGHLLCSLLQLCTECGWEPAALAEATLGKIEANSEGVRANGLPSADAANARVTVSSRRVAIFASTFEPASLFHRAVATSLLSDGFDEVIVCPTGPRPGRGEAEHAATVHRAALTDLTFRDIPGVRVDLTDLDEGRFCQPEDLEHRHRSSGETWHVVGADMVAGGRHGKALIQVAWENGDTLWKRSRFLVVHPPAAAPETAELPPSHRLIPLDGHVPSAEIRARVFAGLPVHELLSSEVAGYVARHRLFASFVPRRFTQLVADRPRLLIVFDERNPRAREIAARYQHLVDGAPDLVLVIGGDGTMLRAIRRHWRLRVPFMGLNAGHLGFLMNERLPRDLHGLELVTYALSMLRVDAEAPDGRTTTGLAYGDVWLERDGGQAAWLRLDVDGQTRVPKVVGDGMLVSTASGSSAYARAMGAVPVPLNSPLLTLAGSNIFHPRFWKPMALTDDSVVAITSLDRSGKRPVRGFLDGQPLGVVQAVTVQRSKVAGAELAFTREFDPSAKLLRSLFPPCDADD
jgi:NAD+ kinase